MHGGSEIGEEEISLSSGVFLYQFLIYGSTSLRYAVMLSNLRGATK